MKRISDTVKAGLVADYKAGMSSVGVSRKWGVSTTAALRLIRAAGVGRTHAESKARQRELREAAQKAEDSRRAAEVASEEADNALIWGHWTPRGLIQVWQPCFFTSAEECNLNHREMAA